MGPDRGCDARLYSAPLSLPDLGCVQLVWLGVPYACRSRPGAPLPHHQDELGETHFCSPRIGMPCLRVDSGCASGRSRMDLHAPSRSANATVPSDLRISPGSWPGWHSLPTGSSSPSRPSFICVSRSVCATCVRRSSKCASLRPSSKCCACSSSRTSFSTLSRPRSRSCRRIRAQPKMCFSA